MSDLALQLTLRAWFVQHFRPMYLADAKPSTVDQYEQLLRLWEATTHDPVLKLIDAATLALFRDSLRARPGRRPGSTVVNETVNKHLRTLNALLAKAGPQERGQRDAMGLLQRVPWIRELRTKRRRPKTFQLEELGALYQNADEAVHPNDLPYTPGTWWRSLFVAAYNLALRRAALLTLRWSAIDVAGKTVVVDAEDDKCDEERFKPLNAITVRHLLAIRTTSPLVFPFTRSWKCFYTSWNAIREAEGVPQTLSFHNIKKTHGTNLSHHASPWQVQQMLDHASIATSMRYVDGNRGLDQAVEELEQPKAFEGGEQ